METRINFPPLADQEKEAGMGAVESLLRKATLVCILPPEMMKDHERLNRAVTDNNVSEIRELFRSGVESLEDTLKAIVKTDNAQLLNNVVEKVEIEVTDGAIRDKGNPINTPVLKYAIEKSALKCVRAFMSRGVCTDDIRQDLMTSAINLNDIDLICQLMTRSTPQEEQTFVLLAAKKGNLQSLETILRLKPQSLSAKEPDTGDSLLHVCARSDGEGSVDCINLLLGKGLDLEERNKQEKTPLHVAAEEIRPENVRQLISQGAQLNSLDQEGRSVLKAVVENVPRAMEEYRKHLDEGISLDKDNITMDYTKIFKRDKMKGETTEMTLFQSLGESPFKDIIEHPLMQSFLHNKFNKVKWYFGVIMLPHFLFSALFSVYCALLFGYLCSPKKVDPEHRFDLTQEIPCDERDELIYTAFVAWIFIILWLIFYIGKEAVILTIQQKKYFSKLDGYRNVAIIVFIILVVHRGPREVRGPTSLSLQRWQYHLAAFTCMLLWLEMLMLVGKIPKFGKYIHMFKSVSMKMLEFFTSYLWLAIGFMMMFIILFSCQRSLSIGNFPGALVTILVMMLGEINYTDLYYPSDQNFNFTFNKTSGAGDISEADSYQQFPVTAHITLISFILVFCLVIMNLLVGLAVSDISKLTKTGKRDQLVAQVELICSVESFRNTKLYSLLPNKLQSKLRGLVDHCQTCRSNTCCCNNVQVKYSDIADKKYPATVKKMLFDFCLKKEKDMKKIEKEKEVKAIREQNEKLETELQSVKELLRESQRELETELRSVKELLRETQQMILGQAPQ